MKMDASGSICVANSLPLMIVAYCFSGIITVRVGFRGVAQIVRAPVWGTGDRGGGTHHPDHGQNSLRLLSKGFLQTSIKN